MDFVCYDPESRIGSRYDVNLAVRSSKQCGTHCAKNVHYFSLGDRARTSSIKVGMIYRVRRNRALMVAIIISPTMMIMKQADDLIYKET